jgi:hypothetical protein
VSLPVRILERDGSCRQKLSFGGLSPEFYGGIHKIWAVVQGFLRDSGVHEGHLLLTHERRETSPTAYNIESKLHRAN